MPCPLTKTTTSLLLHGNHAHCHRFIYRCLCTVGNKVDSVSSKITTESSVDKSVADDLENHHLGKSGQINYHKHPGVMREKDTLPPARLLKAMQILFEKYPVKDLSSKVEKLTRYLSQRQPHVTSRQLDEKTKTVESEILEKDGHKLENLHEQEMEVALEKHKNKVIRKLRQSIYHWKPIQYDAFTSYVYLMGRTAFDYSVLLQNFTEIFKRDANFKPISIFHFGSKVGSGIWAANKIWKTIGEHYCVEESGHMNTIAQLLLQDGNEQKMVSSISGVHFRQFIPSAKNNKFSIVVSSFMLMEQVNPTERLQLVKDLWEMTENYLVLVENGTGAGFNLINEAKEFILLKSQEFPKYVSPGHVFAPCPHDSSCPKLLSKNQPCLTESILKDVDFCSKKLEEKKKKFARYSYVILKKGPRETESEWPRVLHPIQAQRHVHIHACLPCGQLQHVVITKNRFDKHLYKCAKYVQQGDRLPVSLSHIPASTTTEDTVESTFEDYSTEDSSEKIDNVVNSGRK